MKKGLINLLHIIKLTTPPTNTFYNITKHPLPPWRVKMTVEVSPVPP